MVLEDNPFAPWNKEVTDSPEIDAFLAEEEKELQIRSLCEQIDHALEQKDEERFLRLSKKLKELQEQNK